MTRVVTSFRSTFHGRVEVLTRDAAISEHEHLVDTFNECGVDPGDENIVIRIAALENAIERGEGLVFVR